MRDKATPHPPGVTGTPAPPRGHIGLEDRDLVERFLTGTLPAGSFGHRQHLQVAWVLLCRHPPEEAIARFTAGLRRLAAAHGEPDLYHATVTWALLLLLDERIAGMGRHHTFEALLGRHPELLDGRGLLHRHYRRETLAAEHSRRVFVFPDRHLDGAP